MLIGTTSAKYQWSWCFFVFLGERKNERLELIKNLGSEINKM